MRRQSIWKASALVAASLLGLALSAGSAAAQSSCQTDINAIGAKRVASIQRLNALAKSSSGKLDPVAACPLLRSLVSSENELLAYMAKNKEWCAIPDDAMTSMTDGHVKTNGMATKACAVAAQIKKAKEMQAKGAQEAATATPAPKLPAGPL